MFNNLRKFLREGVSHNELSLNSCFYLLSLAVVLATSAINIARADVCFLPDSKGCEMVPYEEYGGTPTYPKDCFATKAEAMSARTSEMDSYYKNGDMWCIKSSCSGYNETSMLPGGWDCQNCNDANSLNYNKYKCSCDLVGATPRSGYTIDLERCEEKPNACPSNASTDCVPDECHECNSISSVNPVYSGGKECLIYSTVDAHCPEGYVSEEPAGGCYSTQDMVCGSGKCYKETKTPECGEGKRLAKANGVCSCECKEGYHAEGGSCVRDELNCMDMCECFNAYASCEETESGCWVRKNMCNADQFEYEGECLACSRCASEIENTLAGNSGSSSTNVCWSASECEQNRIIMRNKYGCETSCVTQHADFCTSGTRYVLDYGPGGPASCGFQTAADLNDSIMYDDETTTCIEQCMAQNQAIPDECMEAPDDEEYLYVEIDSDDSYTIDLKGTNITVSHGVYKIGPNSIFKFTGEYDGDMDYSLGEFDEHGCTSEEGYLHTDGDFRSLAVSGLPSGAVVYITRTVDTSEVSLTCMTGGWYDDEDGGYCDDNTDSCEYVNSYSSDDYTLASFVKEIEDLGGIVNYNNEDDPIVIKPTTIPANPTVYVDLKVRRRNSNECTVYRTYCAQDFNAYLTVTADRSGALSGYTYEVNNIELKDGSYTCNNLSGNTASSCGIGGWQDTYGSGMFEGSFGSSLIEKKYLDSDSHSKLEPGGPVIAKASYVLKKNGKTVYSGTYKAAIPVYINNPNPTQPGQTYYDCDVVKNIVKNGNSTERNCSPRNNCYNVPGTRTKVCFRF